MSEFVSDAYERRLDELAERLMTERFIATMAQPLGAEAVNGMFIQDALLEAEDC